MNEICITAGEAVAGIIVAVIVVAGMLVATASTYYAGGLRKGRREEHWNNVRTRRTAWKQLIEAHPEAAKFYRYWL
jgi:hypothetical protein